MTRHIVKKGKRSVLYNWFYEQIDKIIFVSELAKTEFLNSNPQTENSKMIVIHNSIYPDNLQDNKISSTTILQEFPENTVRLGFVGRIVKEKGIEVLLESLKFITNRKFHLFVIGQGKEEYINELNQFIQSHQLQDKVTFMAFIDNVNPMIRLMDVGVLPSVWREPFGLTIIDLCKQVKLLSQQIMEHKRKS